MNQGMNAKSMSFIKPGDKIKKNNEEKSTDKTKDVADLQLKQQTMTSQHLMRNGKMKVQSYYNNQLNNSKGNAAGIIG